MKKSQSGIKKICVYIMLMLFSVSSVSCAETTHNAQAPNNESPATNDELAYLKVENAIASSFDESPDWAPKPNPMAAVDGDMETRWSSAYKDGEWIYFDFGKPKTISRIIIKWEQAYPPSYEILISNDAKRWERLILKEAQPSGTNDISFNPVETRYVKVVGLSRINTDWGISMWEFEAYGPKDKNSGELLKEELFKEKQGKSEYEKKREELLTFKADEIAPSPGPISASEFQKGINYTSWDKDELAKNISDYSLIYLSELGVGHIALMAVYYQEDAVKSLIYRDEKKTVSDESLGHAINVIHKLGMKVMLKPHVDLADDDARSNIIPSDEWFKNYKDFVLHYAEIAQKYNVELFCIGTELSNTTTSRWKDKWLDIIKAIREIYKGPIAYAANWDEYDTVSFWNEVDYIGMDAYFPLTKKNNPPKEELIAAWEKHANILEKWLKDNSLNKPIIFTEIGYDSVEGSNQHPWAIRPTLATYNECQEEQANCLEAIFVSLTKRPWFKGFYWWNYFPRPDIGSLGYTLRGKLGEKVLVEWFKKLK